MLTGGSINNCNKNFIKNTFKINRSETFSYLHQSYYSYLYCHSNVLGDMVLGKLYHLGNSSQVGKVPGPWSSYSSILPHKALGMLHLLGNGNPHHTGCHHLSCLDLGNTCLLGKVCSLRDQQQPHQL